MYAPETMPGSPMQPLAHDPERQQMDQAEPRYGFRPLALPALAAAAQARKAALKPAPRFGRPGILAIVHEDAPID